VIEAKPNLYTPVIWRHCALIPLARTLHALRPSPPILPQRRNEMRTNFNLETGFVDGNLTTRNCFPHFTDHITVSLRYTSPQLSSITNRSINLYLPHSCSERQDTHTSLRSLRKNVIAIFKDPLMLSRRAVLRKVSMRLKQLVFEGVRNLKFWKLPIDVW
jgi:hypothetical protein